MARLLWALVLALCLGFLCVRAARGGWLQTDLLAQLPATERNPVAERAARALAGAAGDRAVFLVGGVAPGPGRAAARAFARSLEASGAFSGVLADLPPADLGAVPRFYAAYRFRLPYQGGALRDRIEARLASPVASLPGMGPDADPAGHVQAFLERLPLDGQRFRVEDGLLAAGPEDAPWYLVGAGLKGSAFDPLVQAAALSAAARGEGELSRFPGAGLLRTGAVFYAAEARREAERQTHLITWSSLAATVALFLVVFRSARHLALGLFCVAAGVVVASAATLALGPLHLLTLACGASMLGVAVDYPFLYFAHHLGAGPGWKARPALRAILPALVLGAATTILGFAALAAAPFPGLRQMALFSCAGLAGSFFTLVLLVPGFLERPTAARPGLAPKLGAALRRLRAGAAYRPAALCAAAALLALALLRARADDDVHLLVRTPARLSAQEARIRELTGFAPSGRAFLVEGAGEGEVLAREEALRARLAGVEGLEGLRDVSSFVPSPALQDRALAGWEARGPALAGALGSLGFRPDVAAKAVRELREAPGRPLTVAAWLAQPFSAPFRMLWIGATGHGAAALAVPEGPCPSARLRAACEGLPGVTLVDKAESVTGLLGRYRRRADAALAAAAVLVLYVLLRRYGAARGARVFLPAALGILLALGGGACLGLPLTLFSTIALVLVLGFGVDYAVFLAEAGRDPGPAALGILLASFSTLLSFGLLAFSPTPVLQGFGATLGLGVLGSVLAAPIALEVTP